MSFTSRNKAEWRTQAKQIRQHLHVKKLSQAMQEQLRNWETFLQAQTVLTYLAKADEFTLAPLMQAYPQKHWFVPKTHATGSLVFHRLEEDTPLVTGPFQLLEPADTAPVLSPAEAHGALIFIPALMADGNGHRLGYGKGYYDRFLASLDAKITTVCVIATPLISPTPLPHDIWDMPVQVLATEHGILYTPTTVV